MNVTTRQRHIQAMLRPSGVHEKAIVHMMRGLLEYGKLLEASDSEAARAVIRQGLSDVARGVQKLAQGPLGRLNAELLMEALEPFIQENTLSLVANDTDASEELWFPLRT